MMNKGVKIGEFSRNLG